MEPDRGRRLKKNFSQRWQLGGVGYDQWQVTANTGLDKNAPLYSVHAAGLQANYILPLKNFSIFFKYYWKYKAYSTSLGRTLTFGFSWTLPDRNPLRQSDRWIALCELCER